MRDRIESYLGALVLAAIATLALGLGLKAHAQGEGVGTPPRMVITSGPSDSLAQPVNSDSTEHMDYVYRSGGGDVHVKADIQTSETQAHFAHRCKTLVDAFKLEFPPDP